MEIVHLFVLSIGLLLGGFFLYGAWRFGGTESRPSQAVTAERNNTARKPAARKAREPHGALKSGDLVPAR